MKRGDCNKAHQPSVVRCVLDSLCSGNVRVCLASPLKTDLIQLRWGVV